MSLSSDEIALTIAIITFIGGTYLILTGALALVRSDIKIPGFYQLGAFIYILFYGRDKLDDFEKEMMNPKKAVKYGIFWILTGVATFVIGMFLLFVK